MENRNEVRINGYLASYRKAADGYPARLVVSAYQAQGTPGKSQFPFTCGGDVTVPPIGTRVSVRGYVVNEVVEDDVRPFHRLRFVATDVSPLVTLTEQEYGLVGHTYPEDSAMAYIAGPVLKAEDSGTWKKLTVQIKTGRGYDRLILGYRPKKDFLISVGDFVYTVCRLKRTDREDGRTFYDFIVIDIAKDGQTTKDKLRAEYKDTATEYKKPDPDPPAGHASGKKPDPDPAGYDPFDI